jgi:predicted DNA-binding transcriptional regulator YafY
MDFEPTGNMLQDLQAAIDNSTVVHIDYLDKKGVGSSRDIAPLEIRSDTLFAWSIEKNGLRAFKLDGIQQYSIVDSTFDKTNFVT